MKILIIGSAGAVGTALVEGLRDRHELRGFDLVPTSGLSDSIVGDVSDFGTVRDAAEGMDAVIHLATGDQSWEGVLSCGIVGTYNVFEAAYQSGARRVAFASRAGLLTPYPRSIHRTVDMPTRPQNYYSVSKVFGESIGYMYAEKHDLEVVCVRIGNFHRHRDLPEHPHHLSHGDAVRVFERAVVHPGVGFEIVFGVSDSDWPLYDLEHGKKAIGYIPQDKSSVPIADREG